VTVQLHILWELRASRHRPVTVEKSGSRPGVGNDRTGAQLSLHDLQFPIAGLRHNGSRSVPKLRHMWRISFKLILNRTARGNERQAGETTGN
jgi:hypothetical protein